MTEIGQQRAESETPFIFGAVVAKGVSRILLVSANRIRIAFFIAIALMGISWGLSLPPELKLMLLAGGAAILLAVTVAFALRGFRYVAGRIEVNYLRKLVREDYAINVLADYSGRVFEGSNRGRGATFGPSGEDVLNLLKEFCADPKETLDEARALCANGARFQRIVYSNGYPTRLIARPVLKNALLWRVEDAIGDLSAPVLNLMKLSIVETDAKGHIVWRNQHAKTVFKSDSSELENALVGVSRSGCVHVLPGVQGFIECHVTRQRMAGGLTRYTLGEVLRTSDDARLTILDTIPVPLAQITLKGELNWANQKACDLLGIPENPNVDLDTQIISDAEKMSDWLLVVSAASQKVHSKVFRLADVSEEKYVQFTVSIIQNEGMPVAMAVITDATELMALEAQFAQGHKMQAIGQLAGGIAHDFNNLLTAISGHCDLLLLRHDRRDEDFGDLVQINQNANRAAALVNQLLAFSRKQAMNPELLDLRDTLSDLTHLLNRLVGEKVNLTVSHASTLSSVRADKRKLEQVMMNLVVNARDAMPNGGEIRVETSNLTYAEQVECQRTKIKPGDYVQLIVSDDGDGIPPEKLANIFEPFFTTKKVGEGTGLGLSTVYGIVKQTGGYIFAESAERQGTRFTLLFPAAFPEPETVGRGSETETNLIQLIPQTETSEIGDAGNVATEVDEQGAVLLVEDEAPVRAFASRALRLRGINVLEASCGEEALQTLEDPDLDVDVLVTDVVMPGLDGPGWVRIALETRPDVKVVFMSGYTEAALDGEEFLGVDSVFLPKPFSLDELTRTVKKQISLRVSEARGEKRKA